MNNGTNSDPGVETHDLAFLALSAAIELKRVLRDPAVNAPTVDRFVSVLRRTPGLDKNTDIDHLAKDPEAVSLFSNAFKSASLKPAKLDESLANLTEILDSLKADNSDLRRDAQEKMRKFCLALHSRILARRRNLYDHEGVTGINAER